MIHAFKAAGTRRPDGLQLLHSRKKRKTWVWDEYGEAMENDFHLASKKFRQTVRHLWKGEQGMAQVKGKLSKTEDIQSLNNGRNTLRSS